MLRTQVRGRRADGCGLPALHRAGRLVHQRARGRGRLRRTLRPVIPPAGVPLFLDTAQDIRDAGGAALSADLLL